MSEIALKALQPIQVNMFLLDGKAAQCNVCMGVLFYCERPRKITCAVVCHLKLLGGRKHWTAAFVVFTDKNWHLCPVWEHYCLVQAPNDRTHLTWRATWSTVASHKTWHNQTASDTGAISLACSRLLISDFTIGRREGSENVTSKVNLCSFGLYRDYSNSLTSSNVGEPCRSWICKNHIQV